MVTNQINSVFLADWLTKLENKIYNFNHFMYNLILKSLFYDNLLLNDEILVLCPKIHSWFFDRDNFNLFRKFMEMNSLKILTFPQNLYKSKIDIDPNEHPFLARGLYIEKNSSNYEKPFLVSGNGIIKEHLTKLDNLMLNKNNENRLRESGALSMEKNIYLPFKELFIKILESKNNKEPGSDVIQENFSGLFYNSYHTLYSNDEIINDFINYAKDPQKAENILEKDKKEFRQSNLDFNRSLIYRLTTLEKYKKYPLIINDLKNLAESIMANIICDREQSKGLFGKQNKLIYPIDFETFNDYKTKSITIQPEILDSVNIPINIDELITIVNSVRMSDSGKELRVILQQQDVDIHELKNTLREVIAMISFEKYPHFRPIDIFLENIKVEDTSCYIHGLSVGFSNFSHGNLDFPHNLIIDALINFALPLGFNEYNRFMFSVTNSSLNRNISLNGKYTNISSTYYANMKHNSSQNF